MANVTFVKEVCFTEKEIFIKYLQPLFRYQIRNIFQVQVNHHSGLDTKQLTLKYFSQVSDPNNITGTCCPNHAWVMLEVAGLNESCLCLFKRILTPCF